MFSLSFSLFPLPTSHSLLRDASSFSPVPQDRLKLQSVASPSVGTFIRGRLHCSTTPGGTGLPTLSTLSLFLLSALFLHTSFSHLAPTVLFILLSENLRIHGRLASLPDNLRIKICRPLGIAFARDSRRCFHFLAYHS